MNRKSSSSTSSRVLQVEQVSVCFPSLAARVCESHDSVDLRISHPSLVWQNGREVAKGIIAKNVPTQNQTVGLRANLRRSTAVVFSFKRLGDMAEDRVLHAGESDRRTYSRLTS